MDTVGTGRTRLLHVDDHTTVVRPLSSRLEAVGDYHVTVERNVEAAIDSLETDDYDCVLLADTVESTSAGEFCRRVRAAGLDYPVLVLTSDPAPLVSSGIFDAGATDVVDTSSESFLRLLRQRIHLVVDSTRDDVTAPSITRLLADLPLGVFVEDETISYANDAFLELLGVDEPGDRSIADLLDVSGRDDIATGADPQLVTTAGTATDSGTLALWTNAAAPRDDGTTVGALWDLDAGGATLGEFERHHGMVTSLLASLPVATSFRDVYGTYVAVSEAFTELGPGDALSSPTGTVHHASADVVGKTDYDLFPAALATARLEEHEQVTETRRSVRDGGGTFTLGGEERSLETSVAPWYDADGNVVGTVEVARDVSDRAHAEHEATLQRAVFDVVGDAMATELGAAVARLDDSTREHLPDVDDGDHGAAEPVTHVRSIAADLSTVVDAVRTASVDVEPVELGALATAAWRALPGDGTAECTLTVETEAVVLAEPTALERLLAVLLQNAVESGAETIRIGTRDFGFFVADDGPGIPPEERERVFEYGYTTTPDAVGSGLSVADLLATAHQWELSIAESTAGGARIDVEDVRFR